jgi:hypothetical protein
MAETADATTDTTGTMHEMTTTRTIDQYYPPSAERSGSNDATLTPSGGDCA